MTPERNRFRALVTDHLKVLAEMRLVGTGTESTWLYFRKLATWNGAHDWVVRQLEKKTFTLPMHMDITDAIDEVKVAATEVFRSLPRPKGTSDGR